MEDQMAKVNKEPTDLPAIYKKHGGNTNAVVTTLGVISNDPNQKGNQTIKAEKGVETQGGLLSRYNKTWKPVK